MKAIFRNIGPVKEAEMELGELTIIAGQNNTGKTYLAYTLYGFLDFVKSDHHLLLRELMRGVYANYIKKVEEFVRSTKPGNKIELDTGGLNEVFHSLVETKSRVFSMAQIPKIFASQNAYASVHSKFRVALDHEFSAPFVAGAFTIDGRYISYKLNNSKLSLALENGNGTSTDEHYMEETVHIIVHEEIQSFCPAPFILSAERFGISLFYKELDLARSTLVEELQRMADKKPRHNFDPRRTVREASARYAQPVSANIAFTRDLANIQRHRTKFPKSNTRSVKGMMDASYRATESDIRFVSRRRKGNRFDIPLHLASSSARGLSDLYFYLNHVAAPGQILIIDEPESHLSPTNQVLMARLLAFCVNAGLKVLVTTHSDYLIKEINNLIMLNGDFEGKRDFLRRNKKEYTEADGLPPASVKAYTCENGTLTSCTVDETGIDMPVFDDAIDSINRISNHLTFLRKNGD